jgi:hypothetical protein
MNFKRMGQIVSIIEENIKTAFERSVLSLLQSVADEVNAISGKRLLACRDVCYLEGGGKTSTEPAFSIKEKGFFAAFLERKLTFLPFGDNYLEMFRGSTWDIGNRNMLGPISLSHDTGNKQVLVRALAKCGLCPISPSRDMDNGRQITRSVSRYRL